MTPVAGTQLVGTGASFDSGAIGTGTIAIVTNLGDRPAWVSVGAGAQVATTNSPVVTPGAPLTLTFASAALHCALLAGRGVTVNVQVGT